MTAIQELIRQLKGAIQLIDDHGVLNDYAQCRKEVYESVLDNAVSLAASQSSPGSKDVEQWYHNWMAAHDKSEIATVNVLDMLKDFAAQSIPCNVQGYSEADIEKAVDLGLSLSTLYSDEPLTSKKFKEDKKQAIEQFIKSLITPLK